MYYSTELFHEQLAARVRMMRMQYGWSQRDMTMAHGFPTADWQNLEMGTAITVPAMLRLCDVFGVTLPELVDGLGNASPYGVRTA